MMGNVTQLTAVLIGVLVPAAFACFVFVLTRRHTAPGERADFLAALARLHRELRKSFASGKEASRKGG